MSTNTIELLHKNISVILGKKRQKYAGSVMIDALAVLSSLKPGFVFDYCDLTAEKLLKISRECNEFVSSMGKCPEITVISLSRKTSDFKPDIFIINKPLILKWMNYLIQQLTLPLMDVSITNKFPRVISKDSAHITDIIDYIRERIMHCKDNGILDLSCEDHWNMSTICGLLLGYPALYWYSDIHDGNNLSMVPLMLYKVVVSLDEKKKFEPGRTEEMHTIYSFSIPQSLIPSVQDSVDQWQKDLDTRFHRQNIFLNLKHLKETVILPVITL